MSWLDIKLIPQTNKFRVPTAQGKQGKWQEKICVREFVIFARTQGILFAQVVNSMILKILDIAIFAATFFRSVSHIKLLQISEIGTGKFSSRTGKTGNLQIGFEWGPCCY